MSTEQIVNCLRSLERGQQRIEENQRTIIDELRRIKRHVGCEETSPRVAALAALLLPREDTPAPVRSLAGSAMTQAPNRRRQYGSPPPLPGARPPYARLFSENYLAPEPLTPDEMLVLFDRPVPSPDDLLR